MDYCYDQNLPLTINWLKVKAFYDIEIILAFIDFARRGATR